MVEINEVPHHTYQQTHETDVLSAFPLEQRIIGHSSQNSPYPSFSLYTDLTHKYALQHNTHPIRESIGLSLEDRGQEIHRLFGFNQHILAYRLDETSLRMYCRDFYAYLEFAGTVEQASRPATLVRWMNWLATATNPATGRGYSPNTINRMASAVRRIMKEAGKQELLDPSVSEAFKHVEGVSVKALKENLRRHNRVRIDADAMRQIADAPDVDHLLGLRNRALFLTLASTGLRIETFRLLTQDQVVQRDHHYAVSIRSKNEIAFRDVPLSCEAYLAIQAWLRARPTPSPYLFTRFDGGQSDGEHPRSSEKPLSAVSVRAIIKEYARTAGFVDPDTGRGIVKPHDLRRYVGTTVAKRYGPKQAQLILGHKSIKTTLDHYVLEEPEMGITNDLF